MKSEQQYIELYQEASDLIKRKSCEVMNAVRDEAFQQFMSIGFPTRKAERYRYTDVATAFAPNYGISLAPLDVKPSLYIYKGCAHRCGSLLPQDSRCPRSHHGS